MTESLINILKKYYLLYGSTAIYYGELEDDLVSLLEDVEHTIEDLLHYKYITGKDDSGNIQYSYMASHYYQITDKFVEEFM